MLFFLEERMAELKGLASEAPGNGEAMPTGPVAQPARSPLLQQRLAELQAVAITPEEADPLAVPELAATTQETLAGMDARTAAAEAPKLARVAPSPDAPPVYTDEKIAKLLALMPEDEERPSLPGRAAKGFLNRLILSDIESARPMTGTAEAAALAPTMMGKAKIGLERMATAAKEGLRPQSPVTAAGHAVDLVRGFGEAWRGMVSSYYGKEGQAKQAVGRQAAKVSREVAEMWPSSVEFNVPARETMGERVTDVASGLGAFLVRLWAAKRVAAKLPVPATATTLRDALAWELINTDGPPGTGALMSGTLGAIGSLKAVGTAAKLGKLGAESVLFAGLAQAEGADLEQTVISALIPWALGGARAVKEGFAAKLRSSPKARWVKDVLIPARRWARNAALDDLGLPHGKVTPEQVNRAYRERSKTVDPDVPGGSQEAFMQASSARDFLLGRVEAFSPQTSTGQTVRSPEEAA
ncbi:hypothetical protein D4Q85_00615, partial [bacterium]